MEPGGLILGTVLGAGYVLLPRLLLERLFRARGGRAFLLALLTAGRLFILGAAAFMVMKLLPGALLWFLGGIILGQLGIRIFYLILERKRELSNRPSGNAVA